MQFILTNHAKQRLRQRSIPHPQDIDLQIAKNRFKKKIKANCRVNGYEKNLVYWRGNNKKDFDNGKIPVYVCSAIEAGVYTVITAFYIEIREKY
jgi:hypothetical protein